MSYLDDIKKAFAQLMVAAQRQAKGRALSVWEANHTRVGQIPTGPNSAVQVWRHIGAGRKGLSGAQLREIRHRQTQLALERSNGRFKDGTTVDTSRLIDLQGAK